MRSSAAAVVLLLVALSSPLRAAENACSRDVDQAFTRLKMSKAFRLDTTINSDKGAMSLRVDYVLPDRMYQRVTIDGVAMELKVIGTKAWSNQGSGWAELPAQFAETAVRQLKESISVTGGGGVDYKCLGEQPFEGKVLTSFSGPLPMPLTGDEKHPGPRVSALTVPKIQTVYIDKVSGLPVRNIVMAPTEPNKRLYDGTFTVDDSLVIDEPKVIAPATPLAPK